MSDPQTEERRAVTISVELEDDGAGVLYCSACGELARTPAGPGRVGAMVHGMGAAHASLHSTALAQGIPWASGMPWELVQAVLEARR